MSGMSREQRTKFADRGSIILTAMANCSRIAILSILMQGGEISVGALAEEVSLSQSALSQHLAKLRGAGLVRTRREAQTVYYSSNLEPVRKILDVLEEIERGQPMTRLNSFA